MKTVPPHLFILLLISQAVLMGCAMLPASFDIKNDKYWPRGPASLQSSIDSRGGIKIDVTDCCDLDMSLRRANNVDREVPYVNVVYNNLGEQKYIFNAREKSKLYLTKLPSYYIAFDFQMNRKINLILEGSYESGFSLVDNGRTVKIRGKIYQNGELYEAYKDLGLDITNYDKSVFKTSNTEVLINFSHIPQPIFGTSFDYNFQIGFVRFNYDLDEDGKPINITLITSSSPSNNKLAFLTLQNMRFQKTFVNGRYIPRKNFVYQFDYDRAIRTEVRYSP